MTIHAFTDGASRGNPGESGIGIVLKDVEGRLVQSYSEYIGSATNNVAEYTALLKCLQLASAVQCNELIVHSDSELMVRQLNGVYKIRDRALKQFYQRIQDLLRNASYTAQFKYIVREENSEADELANHGIDTKKRVHV